MNAPKNGMNSDSREHLIYFDKEETESTVVLMIFLLE